MKKDLYPAWARWIARDENDVWWCYEAEPHQHDRGWYENEVGRSQKVEDDNRSDIPWWKSLEKIA